MPPESWFQQATDLFGGKIVFFGLSAFAILGLVILLLKFLKLLHWVIHLNDETPANVLTAELLHKMYQKNEELECTLNGVNEEKEKLEQLKSKLEDESRRMFKTNEEKDRAIAEWLRFGNEKLQDFKALTDQYIEALQARSIDARRALVEKIMILKECRFDHSTVRIFGEIAKRVSNMSKEQLDHEVEEFRKITEKMKTQSGGISGGLTGKNGWKPPAE